MMNSFRVLTENLLFPQVKIWFQNRRARERRDHESRGRTILPAVSSQTVLPSVPSPSVLQSARSAFHPVTPPEVTAEGHLGEGRVQGLEKAPESEELPHH